MSRQAQWRIGRHAVAPLNEDEDGTSDASYDGEHYDEWPKWRKTRPEHENESRDDDDARKSSNGNVGYVNAAMYLSGYCRRGTALGEGHVGEECRD
jgi:hypothetical protein